MGELASDELRFRYGERFAQVLATGDPSSPDIADRLNAWCANTAGLSRRAAARAPGMELFS